MVRGQIGTTVSLPPWHQSARPQMTFQKVTLILMGFRLFYSIWLDVVSIFGISHKSLFSVEIIKNLANKNMKN